jgi:hypothetical protein
MLTIKEKAIRALPEQAAIGLLECYGISVEVVYRITDAASGETREVSLDTIRKIALARLRMGEPIGA